MVQLNHKIFYERYLIEQLLNYAHPKHSRFLQDFVYTILFFTIFIQKKSYNLKICCFVTMNKFSSKMLSKFIHKFAQKKLKKLENTNIMIRLRSEKILSKSLSSYLCKFDEFSSGNSSPSQA